MTLLASVLRNALRPGYFTVMAHKALTRLRGEAEDPEARQASLEWCSARVESVHVWAQSLDSRAWAEAESWATALEQRAAGVLRSTPRTVGRGGHYPLLYFLTRISRPVVAVETGVATGFSTTAILEAMNRNQMGHLWSSDFPLFRLPAPESHIGALVADDTRDRWTLFTDGDRRALPRILSVCGPVGLFHYDSDKTVAGRTFALHQVTPRLASGAWLVMDDLQDNLSFRDYVERNRLKYHVFAFEDKYVGVTRSRS